MSKASFAVQYCLPEYRKKVVVLGVTSIVPNLNGVLMFTENGRHHQVESYEMPDNMLCGMSIDYDFKEEEIEVNHEWADKYDCQFELIDGRNK